VHVAPSLIGDKPAVYELLLKQLDELFQHEADVVANLSNTAALLKTTFNWWWVGFYLVKHDELILGPFQGPVACSRIAYGKGVCGTAWKLASSVLVPDVHRFEGHIACSAASNSELVVPVIKNGQVVAVIDADSEHFEHFDTQDKLGIEAIALLLAQKVF
jgi:L-methionine (R)-S-oxide reductase